MPKKKPKSDVTPTQAAHGAALVAAGNAELAFETFVAGLDPQSTIGILLTARNTTRIAATTMQRAQEREQ